MSQKTVGGALAGFSAELAEIVERVAPSVVRVDDGTRLTATGLIIAADGVIVTTSHGVEREEELAIQLADGTIHAATLAGRDNDTDIAVLRVEATELPAIEDADPDEVKTGVLALALARPGRSGLQASFGVVSSRLETQTNGQPGYLVHTDADLFPGFSGGALVNMQGSVIGMTNLMYGRGRGIAVGMPVVREVVQTLLTKGQVKRGYLGIRTQQVVLPGAIAQSLGQKQERALLVIQVEPGSAAEQGGLMLGDMLLRVNDRAVQDGEELRQYLRSYHAGQAIRLHIVRGGEPRDVDVTLGSGE
jgi:serine protease DegQ